MAENLPTFVIHEISARLPCEVDRLHMALACRQWRQALAQQGAPPLLRRLPWLVFPFVEGPAFCCVACGGGIHSTTHHVRAPELERRARYFGSHDGRWLLLAGSRLGINMVTNVRNGCGYLLPDKSIDPRGEVKFGLYIHATALSCSPGCSRSYEVAQYPGFRAGIYFLDDRSFYDDQIMFRGVDERQYPCSDAGKWTQGPPPNIERFFPEEGPSNHSSPAWLLL
ncbi:uncharacterized protein C2845_PM05G29100 [Panicum miliaceum]|uniref:DUF295 domain-containing protein n=1 Tax=Panicum miliaceum TaxID=4540 RepID=A0A3L6SXV4_PANMI|nr:uncharacterized protein C2845_PM05G29100 [Panicum miliaceum]